MIEWVLYGLSIIIGLLLGLLGGGGSILAVPLLVYGFGLNALEATGHSLFIVGVTSLIGALLAAKSGQFEKRAFWGFGLPSVIGIFAMRRWVLPLVPKAMEIGQVVIQRDVVILVIFSVFLVAAARFMIKPIQDVASGPVQGRDLGLAGVATGVITGLVGAGGGFLIVPALIRWAGIGMKQAVGTSLAIISMNALLGFAGDALTPGFEPRIHLLLMVTLLALAGMVLGLYVGRRIPAKPLKRAFGWFILVAGLLIFLKETLG